MADPAQVAEVRAFNRFYTRIIGLLEEGMHKTPYTLAEARLVHEIGKDGVTTAAQVAARLDMDRGQMSRLMLRLTDYGLIAQLPPAGDRRAAPVALTADGRALYHQFNDMSDQAVAETLLEPVDAFQRQDMVGSMARIQAILAEPGDEPLVLRPPRVGEIGWLIHRQGLLYHLEQGWNREFELLIARIYLDYEAAAESPPKAMWIAEKAGLVAGSIFILPAVGEAEGTAQLRMLYTEPAFRGQGIGRRLVEEAVRFSRASGYRRIILWTQDCLGSARRIYQGAGFELLREEPHHSFGVDLNGQYWALEL